MYYWSMWRLLAAMMLPHGQPRGQHVIMNALSGDKVYTSTVALVPPESMWPTIQSTRLRLKDRGLFRWPPHINLLYPFVPMEEFALAMQVLQPALDKPLSLTLETFITLDELGTFGGRSRGVLYAYCSSSVETAALQTVQSALQVAIPFCSEQQKQGKFTPHLTLAHFETRDQAEAAKAELLAAKLWTPVTFRMTDCVHVMQRVGGAGQFERAFTLRTAGQSPLVYDPPKRFDSMPREEEDWMRRSRKEAFKRSRTSGSRRRRPRRTPEERAAILARTPEEIAAIRAERAAKRARLQQEQEQVEQ